MTLSLTQTFRSNQNSMNGTDPRWDKLQSSCQKLGVNLNLYDQNSKEFLKLFFENLFKVGINWESLFDAIDGKSTNCLIVNCRKGPVFPNVEFPACELECFYQHSVGVFLARLFTLTQTKDPSTIVSTSGCSANPNRQQDPTICLNPHHYQIVQLLPTDDILNTNFLDSNNSFPPLVSNQTNFSTPEFDSIYYNPPESLSDDQDDRSYHDPRSREDGQSTDTGIDLQLESKPSAAEITSSRIQKLKENARKQHFWCSISYYELGERVGEVWNAPNDLTSIVIDGFTNPNDGAGAPNRFSLGLLTNINRKDDCDKARRHIGKGCAMVVENGDVWILNQSDSSIFVQSPICNYYRNLHPATVVKIPKDCSIKIFDNEKFEEVLFCRMRNGYEDVFNAVQCCKLRISFVKGWGALYTRQLITMCPCWVELRLNQPLGLLDAALKELQPVDLMASDTN